MPAFERSIPKLQTIAVPRSMQTCQVNVSRTVSGREQVGNGGTIPISGRESVGNDGSVPLPGRDRADSDGTVLNLGQQRLGRKCKNFAVSTESVDRGWEWFSP